MVRKTLTTKEVASLLGVHYNTIYKMVSENQIPHIKMRGKIVFSAEAIQKWMNEVS